MIELLACARMKWWHWHRFGAEALARQGEWDAAIAYADGCRSPQGNDDRWIDRLRGRVDQGTLGGAGVGLARVRLRMSAAKNRPCGSWSDPQPPHATARCADGT